MADQNTYWANLPLPDLINAAMEKVSATRWEPRLAQLRLNATMSVRRYYGELGTIESIEVASGGQVGELKATHVNLYRTYLQQHLDLALGQAPAFMGVPINNNPESLQDALVATDLVEYDLEHLEAEARQAEAAEFALTTGEGYLHLPWDKSLGEAYLVDESGGEVKTGGPALRSHSMFEVVRDRSLPYDRNTWFIVVDRANKYDLAAEYPELVEKILALGNDSIPTWTRPMWCYGETRTNNDTVAVYHLYHKKTPAVPAGLEMVFCDNEVVLVPPIPLAYPEVPLIRVTAGDRPGTSIPHTVAFDLLGPHEAFNRLLSACLSSDLALGTTNVVQPHGNGIKASDMAGGLNILNFKIAPPAAMEFRSHFPELSAHANLYDNFAQRLIGTNPTAMGQVDQRLSGDAIALLDSKALQAAAKFQKACLTMYTKVAQALFQLRKTRTVTEQTIEIVGQDRSYMTRTFGPDNLAKVCTVRMKPTNPSASTPAMKLQEAQFLVSQGVVRSVEKYAEMKATGQVKSGLQGPLSQEMLICRENEMIRQGVNPPVKDTDNHMLHIQEHAINDADPAVRMDPEGLVARANSEHLMGHFQALQNLPPEVLMILGQQPAQFSQQAQAQQRGTPDAEPNEGQPAQQAAGGPETSPPQ